MKGQSFRLKKPTLGILCSDNVHCPVTIPVNAIVTTVDGSLDSKNRLVDVSWEDKTIMMFARDIRDRGEEVQGAAGALIRTAQT